jgi:hypothetical protein
VVYGPAPRQPEGLRLFRAAEGVRFWRGVLSYRFEPGYYGNNRGALRVMVADSVAGEIELKRTRPDTPAIPGECECTLTLNMVDEELENTETQFFVHGLVPLYMSRKLLDLGLFVEVSEHPRIWEFARCEHTQGYAVECPQCLETWRRQHDEERMRVLARDAAVRLGSKELR